jgi:PKD repeat protein
MARRTRRSAVALVAVALLNGLIPATAGAANAPLPGSMAAVGDSITQAASTAGSLGADAPQNSWSTGTSASVNSHYLRLLALNPAISGQNHNRSVSGAKMADLNGQMQQAIPLQPDYLTVLMGGNDVCTSTADAMTPVATFRAQFETAMTTLTAGSPDTYIYVVSIPDAYQLWQLFKDNFWARFIWSVASICQSLLANPTSTNAADVARRAAVRQRNIDYNTQLAEVCAQFARCLFDGNAVFNTQLAASDVSGDYFHPSVSGQARLAAISWAAGYQWGAPPPTNEPPAADFASACTNLACAFTDASTDADGSLTGWAWTFGDGASSTAQNPSHTYSAAGTYTVTLTVTDDAGATDATSAPVTVIAAPASTIHVQDLSATTAAARNSWRTTVSVLVVNSAGSPVAGATVSGSWTSGAPDTCVTGADGRCSATSDSLNKKVASVTFTVTNVTHATLAYAPAQNVESSITVARP